MDNPTMVSDYVRKDIEKELSTDISEYCEEYPVKLIKYENGPWVVHAQNECGNNEVTIDLLEIVKFYAENKEVFQ